MKLWGALRHLLHAQALPAVALGVALLSFAVCPTQGWWRAIDWRTLNLLFCLMFVVAGLRACNLFRVLAQALLTGCTRFRVLAHTLVQLTFFLSMLITNDVALIALVPFALYVLDRQALRGRIPAVVALQTVAANLGSMATPVGNPQNLFLYTTYALSPGAFFSAMLPLTLAGWVLLTLATHALRDEPAPVHFVHHRQLEHPRRAVLCMVLFVLCLLSVFRVFPGAWLFGIVVICGVLFSREALRQVDFGLLVTFLCFFVFSGNLSRLPALGANLLQLIEAHTQGVAAGISQVVSNVPAAILLEPFTEHWKALLWGVDIGGFGTPLASLASLISLRLYLAEPDARLWRYLCLFLLLNLLFFAGLTLVAWGLS